MTTVATPTIKQALATYTTHVEVYTALLEIIIDDNQPANIRDMARAELARAKAEMETAESVVRHVVEETN
jgi:predicted outer membrane protein